MICNAEPFAPGVGLSGARHMTDQSCVAAVETAAAMSSSSVGASVADDSIQFVSFAVDDDQYGVDIMAVREIKGWSEVSHLPKQPDYVRGVLNLRGVMVPIIDLRCRFGQGLTEATPFHVIIVVQVGSKLIGLLADRVLDIVAFEAAQVQPVPRVSDASRADFLSGLVTIDGELIALIDLPVLLALPAAGGDALAA
jgi:purine-binding chemotaxis protein CheW